ncbi:uncharacterized protein LOC124420359 [Lucilia cuprina]|uniref:uncharacterized protein LOC124420359 n=1 Tax=Lucilia cuprina TaxID=7375 RepID=UPI001F067E5B|nr:uncharacterized protein LOC124420359 [Lucilia cuprina]
MFLILILFIITAVLKLIPAQVVPDYPNNYNYNSYITYRPPLNLSPTFSDLNVQTHTTPSPYAYGNPYGSNSYNQVDYKKIRIWPFIIDQYATYPYNTYFNNHYNYDPYNTLSNPYNIRPTLQTYNTNWNQQSLGKK